MFPIGRLVVRVGYGSVGGSLNFPRGDPYSPNRVCRSGWGNEAPMLSRRKPVYVATPC